MSILFHRCLLNFISTCPFAFFLVRIADGGVQIGPTTELFMYNFQSRKLLGVFAPSGPAERDIEPDAWACALPRRFPAQVSIRVRVL